MKKILPIQILSKFFLALVVSFLSFGKIAIAAEDCHRGTLDVAYCDRNMDQTADLPLNPDEWVDPSTLIFTYTPVEDPAVYSKFGKVLLITYQKQLERKLFFFL
jgi:phosphonate transport system substrate-binding protein